MCWIVVKLFTRFTASATSWNSRATSAQLFHNYFALAPHCRAKLGSFHQAIHKETIMPVTMNRRNVAATLLCVLTLHSALAAAQPENGKRRGPPPEAIAACADASQGDSCSFTGRQGEDLQGSCITPPRASDELACLPQGMRPPEHKSED